MIGEYFLDTCITACCSFDNDMTESHRVFSSIKSIMIWYKSETSTDDIPIEFVTKIELLEYLVNYRLTQKIFNFEKMIAIISNGKVKEMIPLLETKRIVVDEEDLINIKNLILSKKKMCEMMEGKKKFRKLLDDIESGNYIDDDEIMSRWEGEIVKSWKTINEVKTTKYTKEIKTLDLRNGNYDPIMNDLRETFSDKNIITTGYKSIDTLFPNNGFERKRLYIIGGTSNIGKSIFLLNLIHNASLFVENNDDEYYLYLTGENTLQESALRLYCIYTGEPSIDVIRHIKEDLNFSLGNQLKHMLNKYNTNIIFDYFKHGSSVQDIRQIIENYRYQGKKIKSLYIDYLDLLRGDIGIKDLRLDLNQVCIDLKQIGIDFEIPVITPTQLNRSGYDTELSPNLTFMSESMKKVDNADFIVFLQPPKEGKNIIIPYNGQERICKKLRMTALKNRSGETGESSYLIMPIRCNNMKVFNYRMEELPNNYLSEPNTNNISIDSSSDFNDNLINNW